ncbi:MAG: pyruvate kinase [Spirochaetota bacterium]
MHSQITDRIMERLLPPLISLRDEALRLEREYADQLARIEPSYRASARNFIHYMSLRRHDIRDLQRDLASVGLSSLGVMEPHVLASLNAVIGILQRLTGARKIRIPEPPVDFRTGPLLLKDQTVNLLGPGPTHRSVRIMVTMPCSAARDPKLAEDLLAAGMDIMRINCAHDDPVVWRDLVHNLRLAERKLGRVCRVQADLAGPKLRTGRLRPRGNVVRVKPARDPLGKVLVPGQARLVPEGMPIQEGSPDRFFQAAPWGAAGRGAAAGGHGVIPLPGELLARSRPGDWLELVDARGRRRSLSVTAVEGEARVVHAGRTVYVGQGAVVSLVRNGKVLGKGAVGRLPEVVVPLLLYPRDTLVLTREDEPGTEAERGDNGVLLAPARVHCTLEAAFDQVKPGERVMFDDGMITGVVRENIGREMTVEIVRTGSAGGRLGPEKGINFPDSTFRYPAITGKDLHDLEQVIGYVDMVALSFLRGPEDVAVLEDHLHRMGAGHLGIVLKIENRQAFENLPRILLTSMVSPPVGVMLARGDLAVEMGFERLSEVQEEILWLCEAAHVPVIWATQLLESMAKKGAPSRAEITDAAMSSRAECAMLNKGPNIVETVSLLNGVFSRMEPHHYKRKALLRKLSIADNL